MGSDRGFRDECICTAKISYSAVFLHMYTYVNGIESEITGID